MIWDWTPITVLNIRAIQISIDKYEIIASVQQADSTTFSWYVEFLVVSWDWELLKSKVNSSQWLSKTVLLKKLDWIIKIEATAKDTIYWDLTENIFIK